MSIETMRNGFKKELEPFLEMLEEKEKTLSREEWISMVSATKERIINAPDQYLSDYLKPSDTLKSMIDFIFDERLN